MAGTIEQMQIDWPQSLQLAGGGERRVWVWLPPGYSLEKARYPVLFMHDGQNVFRDSDATFGTCWSMIAAQCQLHEPMIVVAIEGQNEAIARYNEYSPWPNHDLMYWKGIDETAGGYADDYLDFLCNSIVPCIHNLYHCDASARRNYLGGSSMGGLLTLYASTRCRQFFANYMAMSTATWFAHEELLTALRSHSFTEHTRIYCDVGTAETSMDALAGYAQIYLQGNQQLAAVLAERLPKTHLRFQIDPHAKHCEADWARRLPAALDWLSLEV